MRRAAHDCLRRGVVGSYHQTQVKEAVLVADGFLKTPSSWEGHFYR